MQNSPGWSALNKKMYVKCLVKCDVQYFIIAVLIIITAICSLFSCTDFKVRTCQCNNIITYVHRIHIFSHYFSPPEELGVDIPTVKTMTLIQRVHGT